ncbi:MAG: glycerate kinase [Gaiellaceae bacterium]
MSSTVPRALAAPAGLKGVLGAPDAATAIVEGLERAGVVTSEAVPVADGGEGTAAVLAAALGGEWHGAVVADPLGRPVEARWLVLPDGTGVVEAAEAIGLSRLGPDERDPLRASSRGLGELIHAALDQRPDALIICLGGTATVDGGAGLLELLGEFPVPVTAACDVRSPLLGARGAARVFGPQKGAGQAEVEELEQRLASRLDLAPFARLAGAGAAGGLGAALAALGAELVWGAELVLEAVGLRERIAGAALVVTGEGTVDHTTFEGKAPSAVLGACAQAGVRCALFGGRVVDVPGGVEAHALSGAPARAREDLVALGEWLGAELVAQELGSE